MRGELEPGDMLAVVIHTEMIECFILGFGLEMPDEGLGRPIGLMPLWAAVKEKCGDCNLDELLDALYNLDRSHAELNKYILLDAGYQAVSFERKRCTPKWKDFFYGDPFRIKVLPAGRTRCQVLMAKSKDKKRFAVGTKVLVTRPGVAGVVTQLDDEPASLWEYWHTIETKHGHRREPGCNLELIPRPLTDTQPVPPVIHSVHFHGNNPRMNVNSTDNSTNVVSASNDVFVQMYEKARSITDENEREAIVAKLEELQRARGSGRYVQAYQDFIALAADHITVFGPFMQVLAQWLTNK